MEADAVAAAIAAGVVVVAAAGNEDTSTPSYPAAYPHAIAVAATQFDETTTFYSNWGKEIDIAAPGGNTRDAERRNALSSSRHATRASAGVIAE